MRPLFFKLSSLAVVLALGSQARAQYPGATPQVSPYVTLGRSGDPAGLYYGLIRPQQQLQAGLASAQQALINEHQFLGTQEALANAPVVTGNFATFQTQGRYFMTRGAGQRGIGLPGSYAGAGPPTSGITTGAGGGFLSQPAGTPTGRP
jgi:hypothetical protein